MIIGLDNDPAILDARIDARVDRMFANGLGAEVRELLSLGLREGRTASRALGYQHVLAALDAGADPADATGPTAQATRRFSRRQRSWFRRDGRIRWLDSQRPDLLDAVFSLMVGG
jgi:tRNA dimethylallyltransferase